MKWRASPHVPMILDVVLGIWSLIWVIANALWWHSVWKGSCAGILVGWSGASLMYRGFMAYWKRSAEFWKENSERSLEIVDGWKDILRDIDPQGFDQLRAIAEARMEQRKRLN